eukprot:1486922-Pyramimonas_sp.AAC.1
MKGTRHTATHIATHEGHKALGGERRRRRNKVVGTLDTLCKRIIVPSHGGSSTPGPTPAPTPTPG